MHIHLVYNSVSGIDGHKYHYCNGDWRRIIQPIVNEVCAEQHLSTLDMSPKGFTAQMDQMMIDRAMSRGQRLSKEEWLEQKKNLHTWAEFAAADIDSLLPEVTCFEDIVRGLQNFGWEVKWKTKDGSGILKHFSVRPPAKACDMENNHAWLRPDLKCGYGYSREGLEKRIELGIYNLDELTVEETFTRTPVAIGTGKWPKHIKKSMTDYQRRYLRYLYRTDQMNRRMANQIPMEWRTDVRSIYETKEMVEYMLGCGLKTEDEVEVRIEELKIRLIKAGKDREKAKEIGKEIEMCGKILNIRAEMRKCKKTEQGMIRQNVK